MCPWTCTEKHIQTTSQRRPQHRETLLYPAITWLVQILSLVVLIKAMTSLLLASQAWENYTGWWRHRLNKFYHCLRFILLCVEFSLWKAKNNEKGTKCNSDNKKKKLSQGYRRCQIVNKILTSRNIYKSVHFINFTHYTIEVIINPQNKNTSKLNASVWKCLLQCNRRQKCKIWMIHKCIDRIA